MTLQNTDVAGSVDFPVEEPDNSGSLAKEYATEAVGNSADLAEDWPTEESLSDDGSIEDTPEETAAYSDASESLQGSVDNLPLGGNDSEWLRSLRAFYPCVGADVQQFRAAMERESQRLDAEYEADFAERVRENDAFHARMRELAAIGRENLARTKPEIAMRQVREEIANMSLDPDIAHVRSHL